MSGVSASHCCDGRRKRKRKSVSPCYKGEPPARLGPVQTLPPCSLPGSCFALAVHPPRVPGGPCRGHKSHLAAGRAAPTRQRRGDLKWSKFPVVSPCLQCHCARPRPRSTSTSQGVRGSCLAVAGAGGWQKPRLEPRRAESRAPSRGAGAGDGEQHFGGPRTCWGRSGSGGGTLAPATWGALVCWDPWLWVPGSKERGRNGMGTRGVRVLPCPAGSLAGGMGGGN